MAIAGGSTVLLLASWATPRFWHQVRFAATSALATFLAFAGIVGLEAPNATASWLFGAGMAGLGRAWVDHLIRAEERQAAEHLENMLHQLLRQTSAAADYRRRETSWPSPAILLAALLFVSKRPHRK